MLKQQNFTHQDEDYGIKHKLCGKDQWDKLSLKVPVRCLSGEVQRDSWFYGSETQMRGLGMKQRHHHKGSNLQNESR